MDLVEGPLTVCMWSVICLIVKTIAFVNDQRIVGCGLLGQLSHKGHKRLCFVAFVQLVALLGPRPQRLRVVDALIDLAVLFVVIHLDGLMSLAGCLWFGA